MYIIYIYIFVFLCILLIYYFNIFMMFGVNKSVIYAIRICVWNKEIIYHWFIVCLLNSVIFYFSTCVHCKGWGVKLYSDASKCNSWSLKEETDLYHTRWISSLHCSTRWQICSIIKSSVKIFVLNESQSDWSITTPKINPTTAGLKLIVQFQFWSFD